MKHLVLTRQKSWQCRHVFRAARELELHWTALIAFCVAMTHVYPLLVAQLRAQSLDLFLWAFATSIQIGHELLKTRAHTSCSCSHTLFKAFNWGKSYIKLQDIAKVSRYSDSNCKVFDIFDWIWMDLCCVGKVWWVLATDRWVHTGANRSWT